MQTHAVIQNVLRFSTLDKSATRIPIAAQRPGPVPKGSTSDHIKPVNELLLNACEIADVQPIEIGQRHLREITATRGKLNF